MKADHIPQQRYRVTNWAEYDAALRQRGSLTVWFTDAAIAAWRAEPRTTPGGQPSYSALAIATALTLRAEPVHLLVDSTGLKLCGASGWLVERHGTRTPRPWRKLHLGINADTGKIVAAELTTNDVDDGSQGGPLLDLAAGPVASFTRDGAYDRDDVYGTVAERYPDAAASCRSSDTTVFRPETTARRSGVFP